MENHQHLQTLRSIAFIVGVFLLVFSLTMVIPAITNKYLGYEWKNFLAGFVITCISGAIFVLLGKLSKLHGMPVVFAITSCAWIALSLFAAIPFYLDSLDYVDALFETISGFTTTGTTVFSDVEKLSPGILLWRAMLHGIGGFGIITIGIAVFPMLRVLSLSNLLYSECSDVTKRRLPNYLAGMPLFDAICHGMSAVSTGGFANYNDSIGHYNDPLLEVITIIFMILGSLPFLSYLKIIRQLVSVLAFFLTFIGGCGGSASGGIKIFRLIVFLRSIGNRFRLLLNPDTGDRVKFNGKILEDDEVHSIFTFFAIYILTFTISSIVMSYLGNTDFITSISAVSATLTNSGSGFSNLIGPSGNYSSFSSGVKLFLSFLMLLGRLEILPIYFCIGNLLLFNRRE